MREASDMLIVGIGNLLLADDGVGVHAVEALRQQPPPGVVLVDGGTAVLHVLPFVERARRVLVLDAVQAGGRPGTLYSLELDETKSGDWRGSMHALGLREALRSLAPELKAPPITVLGVEPQDLHYSMELSAPVRAVLPQLVAAARQWAAGQAVWAMKEFSVPGQSALAK